MKVIFFSNKTVIYRKRVRNATIFRSFHRELEEAGTGAKSSSVALPPPSFSFNFKLGWTNSRVKWKRETRSSIQQCCYYICWRLANWFVITYVLNDMWQQSLIIQCLNWKKIILFSSNFEMILNPELKMSKELFLE